MKIKDETFVKRMGKRLRKEEEKKLVNVTLNTKSESRCWVFGKQTERGVAEANDGVEPSNDYQAIWYTMTTQGEKFHRWLKLAFSFIFGYDEQRL